MWSTPVNNQLDDKMNRNETNRYVARPSQQTHGFAGNVNSNQSWSQHISQRRLSTRPTTSDTASNAIQQPIIGMSNCYSITTNTSVTQHPYTPVSTPATIATAATTVTTSYIAPIMTTLSAIEPRGESMSSQRNVRFSLDGANDEERYPLSFQRYATPHPNVHRQLERDNASEATLASSLTNNRWCGENAKCENRRRSDIDRDLDGRQYYTPVPSQSTRVENVHRRSWSIYRDEAVDRPSPNLVNDRHNAPVNRTNAISENEIEAHRKDSTYLFRVDLMRTRTRHRQLIHQENMCSFRSTNRMHGNTF